MSSRQKSRARINRVFIITMLFIPIVHWLIFCLGVNANSILMAFQIPTGEWSMQSMEDAFRSFSDTDSNVRIAIKNTLIYFTKDILMMAWHIIISYFFFKKIRFYRGFQILFYIPGIVSGVAIASMFSNFVAPDGPIGLLMAKMGIDPVPQLLANSDYATGTIVFYTIWLGWAGNMLLFGGAMARIPTEILESARLDGINIFQEIVYMVIPLIWPTMSTLLILSLTGIFGAGGPILLFTKGLYKTTTIGYWIFDKVKFSGAAAYNEVSAVGLILTVVGVPVILFFKWLKERVPVVDY